MRLTARPRVSGQNNAKIYQEQHWKAEAEFPLVWPILPRLDGPTVSDAFFLFALLRDHDEHGTLLVLQNDTNHSIRLDGALRQRNMAMVGPGQEQWNHICDRCCAQKVDGGVLCKPKPHWLAVCKTNFGIDTMRAVVTDGVTVGRPCCGVHDCKGRLLSQRARFCDVHINLERQCSILGCENDAEASFKTCTTESHRAMEITHTAKRSALFQLRQRLERLGQRQPDPDGSSEDDPVLDDELDADEEGGASTNAQSSPKIRARFGRRWTHNEQLCVATCGVVLGRMTMYGSEAISGIKVGLNL